MPRYRQERKDVVLKKRLMVNSSRHRGYRVIQEAAIHTKLLLCSYHSWRYDLTGKLMHAPGTEAEPE